MGPKFLKLKLNKKQSFMVYLFIEKALKTNINNHQSEKLYGKIYIK